MKIKGDNKMKEQKVYSVDFSMILKYQGVSKHKSGVILNALLEHNQNSEFYQKYYEVNPYELVRLEFVNSAPQMYTLASSAKVANGRFLEVLVPLLEVEPTNYFDADILESMLEFNTKVDTHIKWVPTEDYQQDVKDSFTFKPDITDILEVGRKRESKQD